MNECKHHVIIVLFTLMVNFSNLLRIDNFQLKFYKVYGYVFACVALRMFDYRE